jgi:RHS repeat-associated protein
LGEQERFVYKVENTVIAKSESPTPAGMTIYSDVPGGQYLQYRNTFHWDKKAMQSVADPNNPDWAKARILHWLHNGNQVENGSLVAAGVLESEKRPLERRIWYAYPGQTDNRFLPDPVNGMPYPSKVARVLDDGQTQTYQYAYNNLGRVTSFTDPLGRVSTYVYDANLIDLLEVHQTTPGYPDQLLRKITYNPTYNAIHQPWKVQDTAGQTSEFRYNARGQLIQVFDPKGQTTTLDYDPTTGFLLSILRPDVPGAGLTTADRTLSFTPDNFFRVLTATDGDGKSATSEYDNLDRQTKTTHEDGTTEQVIFQKLQPALVKDRLNRWMGFEYDAVGRVILTRDTQQRTTRFEYCSCGGLTSLTDPNGQTTTWLRDLQGRVTAKILADNSRLTYTYEPSTSRIKTLTDALNQTTTYSYNLDNNLSSVVYSGALVSTPSVSFTYDPQFNRTVTMQDGTGITTYAYKPIIPLSSPPTQQELTSALGAGQLQSIDGPLSNDTITLGYDELGRVNFRAINGIAQTLSFDALGRTISVNNALDNFSYTYESASSRLKTMSRSAGQVLALTYFPNTDAQNQQRLKTILNKAPNGTAISQFDYDFTPDGRISTWTRQSDGNPATASFYALVYDSVNQLSSAPLSNGTPLSPGSVVKQFGYGYDNTGNRLTDFASSPALSTTTEKFNNLNQVVNRTAGERLHFTGTATDSSTPVTVNVGGVQAVMNGSTFDGDGIASVDSNVVAIVARDSAGNRATNRYQVNSIVASGDNKTFSYDLNGNLAARISGTTTTTYEWDAANRLTAAERVVSGARVSRSEFTYDGLGRRIAIVDRDGSGNILSSKRFVWMGPEICEERDSAGITVTKRFFPQGEVRGTTKYYYTRDHLGSVREVVDAAGIVKVRYDYDPFGASTKVSGTIDCDFGFSGHYSHPASGLLLSYYRAYDVETGRWLSRDPASEMGGLNVYAYVHNNPINDIDPLGLWNLWNPATWGDSNPNGWSVWNSLTPWHESSGYTWEGIKWNTGQAAQATLDGIIPFWDPFKDNGGYDPCDKALAWSRRLGAFSRDIYAGRLFSGAFSAGSKSVFWSGGESAKLAAMDYATANGLQTMEMTIGGKALQALSNFLLERGVPYSVVKPLWQAASANFAANATGDVVAVLTRINPSSVWMTIERPILMLKGLWTF